MDITILALRTLEGEMNKKQLMALTCFLDKRPDFCGLPQKLLQALGFIFPASKERRLYMNQVKKEMLTLCGAPHN